MNTRSNLPNPMAATTVELRARRAAGLVPWLGAAALSLGLTGLMGATPVLAQTDAGAAATRAEAPRYDGGRMARHAGAPGAPMMGMHGDAGMGLFGLGHPRMAERLLDSVGASAEQKAQLRQIMQAAGADLKAQREAGAPLREQWRQLMVQPTVDARAAEQLRQQMLAEHDQSSRRMMQAALDASRVLTPEQRQALAEQMAQRQAQRQAQMQQRRGDRAPN